MTKLNFQKKNYIETLKHPIYVQLFEENAKQNI